MDVQSEVLEELVCDYCGEYLSIGPVMLLEEDKSVCGRCHAPDPKEHIVLRNLPYELLAKDFLFPCQNKRHGCTVERQFNSLKSHEATCDFRQYTCFLLETRSCPWFGTKKDILDHCKVKHPDLVVENPVTFQHDVAQKSVKNFVMAAFNLLFVIHTKVCLQSKKIYHCVRLLADVENIKDYGYTLDISQERNSLRKQGIVAAQGCLAIKENESVAIGINSLIEVFDGYAGTTFKLTVNSFGKEPSNAAMNHIDELFCATCKRIITYERAYYVEKQWKCMNCINNKHKCLYKHEGCTFTSTFNKLYIHSLFYCNYSQKCFICAATVNGSLDAHYDHTHSDIIHASGCKFTETTSRNKDRFFIIKSDCMKMHCTHVDYGSWFAVSVCSLIDSGELHFYTLELKIENPVSRYIIHKNMPIYNENHIDWYIKIETKDFLQCVADDKFNLKITIRKVKNNSL